MGGRGSLAAGYSGHKKAQSSLAFGQVAEEEEARRCHRLGRRTGTNAIGWLAGLVARLPLPWRAVQGQTAKSRGSLSSCVEHGLLLRYLVA